MSSEQISFGTRRQWLYYQPYASISLLRFLKYSPITMFVNSNAKSALQITDRK